MLKKRFYFGIQTRKYLVDFISENRISFSFKGTHFWNRIGFFSIFSFFWKKNSAYAGIMGFLVFFMTLLGGLKAQSTLSQFEKDSIWVVANYEKKETYITMRDGKRLFTSILTPRDKTKKYPILLNRTPYTCAPYGESNVPPRRFEQKMHLFREGFIFVAQDVRGRFMSEGEYADIRPHNPKKQSKNDIDESSDTYDTVDWLVKNLAQSNGKVGIYGISYPGFYATASLPDAHPALKCASPQAPVTDWFIGDDFHHNGAFFLQDAFGFYYSFGQPRPELTQDWPPSFEYPIKDNYAFHLRTGALRNYDSLYIKGKVKFWNDLFAHPDMDPFWQARNIRPHLKSVRPAVMTVGGLFDAEDCWGAFATYQAIEKQSPGTWNVLVNGPWTHGGWHRSEGDQLGDIYFEKKTSLFFKDSIELPFFKHFLKDAPAPNLPEAYIFTTGSNEWHRFEQWPPKNIQKIGFFFNEKNKLGTQKPSTEWASDAYYADPAHPVPYEGGIHLARSREYMAADQRFASRRPDVLTYQTDVLEKDITVLGGIEAALFLTTTATDADFVVKVIDVYPDDAPKSPVTQTEMSGYQMLVRGEIMRARYRNSLEKPEALLPGRMEKVAFELPDVAHTFKKGHRIMVQIQSSWFPLADRNPQQFINIYTCFDSDFKAATHDIHRSAAFPSAIYLPIQTD